MATPIGASALVAALKKEGLRVVEVGGWRTHNRNHKGAWGPVHGVEIHHTVTSGSAATVRICRDGYAGLPGPLCHGVITKDGTVHLVGHGRANHAGLGDDDVLRAVIAERSPLPPANETNTDGNRHFYGFECENLGDGRDPWPAAQLDAIERAAAALCRHHGWKAESVIGHLEWQPGKVDPRGFSMTTMRARIRERLDHAPGWDRGEGAAEPAAGTEDELPEYLSIGQTSARTLPPGRWSALTWDTEWTDTAGVHHEGYQTVLTGPASYVGDLRVRVDGLTAGAELQARIVLDRADGRRSDLPWDEAPATSGTTTLTMPVTGRVGQGTRLRLMVCHYGDEPVRIERAELKLHVWRG
ncbi:N-acetylmuramoyl-L-alanine amidase [Streptomyces sp. TRM43335]|uniref:N-acetylmuramoyl-L-alanine amidase n=1 Tax=Streptomyces taklimakanensis TaxID=2569853 RepID=A0A6G2BDX5_9ACTN|nr:N-acetylmuramoyl-L-alanine amidase [Streptomyces taklimakanensis]MTE20263.1 N-acetylmuramoyl-L-alanine amidase [Streptomyces taklimakanensis]